MLATLELLAGVPPPLSGRMGRNWLGFTDRSNVSRLYPVAGSVSGTSVRLMTRISILELTAVYRNRPTAPREWTDEISEIFDACFEAPVFKES